MKAACEEKLENSKKLYEGCVKAREVEEYNMSKHVGGVLGAIMRVSLTMHVEF